MKQQFLMGAAAFALLSFAPSLHAETVTTKTYVQQKDVPNINTVDFSVFDLNGDGEYSMQEIGERLFKSFDGDGNGLIDNIEWTEKNVMTISPMDVKTFKFIDEDNDGMTEVSTVEYDTVFQASGLAKFDKNYNGLSAQEFIGESFQTLDDDNNNMINLEEWKEAYLETSTFPNAEPENYNR